MLQKISFLLSFTFLSFALSAQDYLTIKGTIKDKSSGDDIAFAHVGVPEGGIGTMSSDNGYFYLKVPSDFKDSKLIASFMGYKTYRISLSKIDGHLTVLLERSAKDLTEIIVMDQQQVVDIVRRAIKAIPKNYPTKSLTHQGFYRESRTDSSLNYVYLAEGVLNIYQKSYKNKKEGYTGLIQGRMMNLQNPLDTFTRSGFSSGHMAAHRFDFVKNREDFIDTDLLTLYKYRIESITTYNDRPVYIIAFEPEPEAKIVKKKGEDGFVTVERNFGEDAGSNIWSFFNRKKKTELKGRLKGKMYIDKESFAFIRAEFEVTKEGLEKYNDYPLYSGNWDGNKYIVNYRQLGEKWYFSDALREGLYGRGGLYNNEIKITELNTKPSSVMPYTERLRRKQAFAKVTGTYDEDFWKNYNTTPLSEALVESVRQMENSKKAAEVFNPEYLETLEAKRDSIALAARTVTITDENGQEKIMIEPIEPGTSIQKNSYRKVKTSFGLGTHLVTTTARPMFLRYKDTEDLSILELNNSITDRDFEVIGNFNMDFFIHKNFFIRAGTTFDFINSIYREVDLGLGTQINFSKGRPVMWRAAATVDRWAYARKIGQAENSYGKFEVRRKNFNAKKINLYYGSRTFNLKLSTEFAIEVLHAAEIFIRGTYFIPFSSRRDVWFFERRQIFRKKRFLPADNESFEILSNDVPFDTDIIPGQTFSLMIGLTF